MKSLLPFLYNGQQQTKPFGFKTQDGKVFAQNAGIVGFLTKKTELEERYNKPLTEQLNNFFMYLGHMCSSIDNPALGVLNEQLTLLGEEKISNEEKSLNINRLLRSFIEENSGRLRKWIRTASIYEIFPRVFNLPGFQNLHGLPINEGRFFSIFGENELKAIWKMGFDSVYFMGIFEIGTLFAKGSPYCIKNHKQINPELGSHDEFKRVVKIAHGLGMKVIVDFVPNHTSFDHPLVENKPEWYIHARHNDPLHSYKPICQNNIRCGGYRKMKKGKITHGVWEDVAQLNLSLRAVQEHLAHTSLFLSEEFGVDGLRCDTADHCLAKSFKERWGVACATDPWETIIGKTRESFPHIVFIAESHYREQQLLSGGFDTVYTKASLYDSLTTKKPAKITKSIHEMVLYFTGNTPGIHLIGSHDLHAPHHVFGEFVFAATALAYLLPAPILHYGGQEVGFDARHQSDDDKCIPFTVPAKIEWKNNETFRETLKILKARKAMIQAGPRKVNDLDEKNLGYKVCTGGGIFVVKIVGNTHRIFHIEQLA